LENTRFDGGALRRQRKQHTLGNAPLCCICRAVPIPILDIVGPQVRHSGVRNNRTKHPCHRSLSETMKSRLRLSAARTIVRRLSRVKMKRTTTLPQQREAGIPLGGTHVAQATLTTSAINVGATLSRSRTLETLFTKHALERYNALCLDLVSNSRREREATISDEAIGAALHVLLPPAIGCTSLHTCRGVARLTKHPTLVRSCHGCLDAGPRPPARRQYRQDQASRVAEHHTLNVEKSRGKEELS
jgi:hypothetical protein